MKSTSTNGSLFDFFKFCLTCLRYNFDELKGNLLLRTDYLPYNKSETFEYDDLNRLTHVSSVNYTQFHTTFAPDGNITQKSDIGTYTYGDYGPHAASGLTNTIGSLLPANNQTIDYTAFNKASHISQGSYDYFITYGTSRQRSMSRLINGITEDILQTKYYAFGDYEKEVTPTGTRHLHYISGGDGLAAIYVKYNNAPDSLYFIINDHLGSIVGAINDETGTVFRQNFDAWGRKRNPVTWSYTNIPDFLFDRGYTGHEHLKWFGLINMNGRMYDAALCRFLSPDPYVQMPDYTQNFNRYSYALNNPLIYSDPSGEFIFTAACLLIPGAQFLLPIAIGADIGALTGWIRGANTQGVGFLEGAARGAVVGAVGGALSMVGGAGMAFGTNLLLGTAEGAATGALDAAIWGNDVGQGILWGAASGALFTTITSQNLKNAVKGNGFKTNSNVFEDFMTNPDMGCQEIVDYFGFEGTYDQNSTYPGSLDVKANIKYNDLAFAKNYDYLRYVASEEYFHKIDLLSGNYSNVNWNDEFEYLMAKNTGEWKAKMFQYKNQGLFLMSGENITKSINYYGNQIGKYLTPDELFKDKSNLHFLYKIPRRW